jgi:hypothetical protein
MERQDGSFKTDSQSVIGKGVRQETHFVPEMPSPPIADLWSAALPGSCLTPLPTNQEVPMHRKHTSELLTKYLNVRVPEEDYQGFHKLADFFKVSPGRLIRHLLRENILGQSDPLPDHLKSFREAVYQFAAAGRNLNQLVRAVNSGDPIDQRQVRAICEELQAALAKANMELKGFMSRRRKLESLEPRQAA